MQTKVVLAFSGGLAARAAVHILRMRKGYDVTTFTPNLGQRADPLAISERALELGVASAHIGDLRERFARDYVAPCLRAGAIDDVGCTLAPALARPLVVAEVVKIARQEGAKAIAHACTGKSNDQIRFEAAAAAIAPDLQVLHPLRDCELHRFDQVAAYAERHDMPTRMDDQARFTIRENLWGVVCDTAPDLDPWDEVPAALHVMTTPVEKAPDEPQDVVIGFDAGIPVSLDGQKLALVALIQRLNEVAGRHGIGRIEVVEDRLLGIKTRDVYEAPAAAVLFHAKRALEHLVCARELLRFKRKACRRYQQLIYDGHWFNELRDAMDAFFRRANERVTGEVRMRLFKGSARATGRRSPHSLLNMQLSTTSDAFDQGFMNVFSHAQQLRPEIWAKDTLED